MGNFDFEMLDFVIFRILEVLGSLKFLDLEISGILETFRILAIFRTLEILKLLKFLEFLKFSESLRFLLSF